MWITRTLPNRQRQLTTTSESSQYGRKDRRTFSVTLRDEPELSGGTALGELLVGGCDAIKQIGELTLLIGAQDSDRPRRLAEQLDHAGCYLQPGVGEHDGAHPAIRGVRLPAGQSTLLESVDHGRDVGRVAREGGGELTHRRGTAAGEPQQRLHAGRGEIVLLTDVSQAILTLTVKLDLLHGTPRPPGIEPELLAERAVGSGDGHRAMVTG